MAERCIPCCRCLYRQHTLPLSESPVAVTVYDKWAAKHRTDRRIRESSLLAFSVLGGSAAMFVTMLIIRHKTKHPKFMIGIPVIMAVQAALVWFAVKYLHINIVL